jgi:hypothetical protein
MSVRGEFRSVPSSRYDRVELHQLSHLAFRVYMTLDGTNGATGMKAVYRSIMSERCGCTPAELDDAYRELQAPLPGRELGWILVDGNVVWVIDRLGEEETISPANEKQRKFVHRLVEGIDQTRAIVRRFKAHYPEWFPEDVVSVPREASERVSHRVSDRVSIHRDGNGNGDGARKSESDGVAPTARLASLRDRFFATFYGGATAERRGSVDTQLDATLSAEGCVVRRRPHLVKVHATHATLANALQATLGEGVDKPDSAIVVVLKKLESGRCNLALDASDRTVTEAAAHDAQQEACADHRDRSRLLDSRGSTPRVTRTSGPSANASSKRAPGSGAGRPAVGWLKSVRQGVLEGAVLQFYHDA